MQHQQLQMRKVRWPVYLEPQAHLVVAAALRARPRIRWLRVE
jgi:hypothetical protein